MSDGGFPSSQVIYLKWGIPPLVLHSDQSTILLWVTETKNVKVKLVDGSIVEIARDTVAMIISPPAADVQ